MDLTQAMQMINWLETERKRDKAVLSELQEKSRGLAAELSDQVKRIQELQTALNETQLRLGRMAQYDKLFEQFKADLVGEMDRRDSSLVKSMREADQVRRVEVEGLNRAITEVRKELPRFKPLEDEMPLRRAEERRLSEQIMRQGQRLDELAIRTEERIQNVIYVEEGRRQDSKRIAQLEEGHTIVLKRVEALAAKIVTLEENLQRMPSRIEEAHARVLAQEKVIEEVRLNDFRRSQEIKSFTDQVRIMIEPIPDYVANAQSNYQRVQEISLANQRSLDELQGFQNRIDKRQSEVSEMQRIAEERMRKQVEEWQSDQEKRWKRQMIVWSEQWQEHDRAHVPVGERLDKLEQDSVEFNRQFRIVWDGLDDFSKVYLTSARQVVETQLATLEKGRPSKVVLTGDQVVSARKTGEDQVHRLRLANARNEELAQD